MTGDPSIIAGASSTTATAGRKAGSTGRRNTLDMNVCEQSVAGFSGRLPAQVLRGLVLTACATASSASDVCQLRSVPFGKYCRSMPLVFSFVRRCHGLCGSQK